MSIMQKHGSEMRKQRVYVAVLLRGGEEGQQKPNHGATAPETPVWEELCREDGPEHCPSKASGHL